MSNLLDSAGEAGNKGLKSLDKLEIEKEEEDHIEMKEVENGGKIQNGENDSTLQPKSTNLTPKSKLHVRIPEILRLRSKERSDKESVGGDQKEGLNSSLNGKTENPTNGTVQPGSEETSPQMVTVELSDKGGETEKVTELNVSTTSFLSSLSTPRWSQFRRVFNFNRSVPTSMDQEVKRNDSVVAVSVILNIQEESGKETGSSGKKTKDDSPMGDQVDFDGGTVPQKNFMTPLFRIFKAERANTVQREVDLESSVVKTELVERNREPEPDQNGVKIDQTEPIGKKESPQKPESDKCEKARDQKELPSDGETPTKISSYWRQRLMGSDRKKMILAGISILFLLVTTVLVLSFFPTNKAIDIGSLIIGGKFINTITSCGPVQGVLEDGGYVFRGIPYALPPVGELRWRPAQTHSKISHCWNGTLEAKHHATPCWQFYRNGSYDGSEDCLYLDVYTPKPFYDSPLPVVVYIGGDSLSGGESFLLRPSVKMAVEKNVVFVNVAIRRFVLGFLAVEPLSRSSYPMTSGNYGLSDILAALHWVQINVEHFGGDRYHVTLLGHQSGASLALALLSSHLSKGLFHQVWTSGGSSPKSLISLQEAEAQNKKFLTEVGCSSVECLHNKGPEELLESVPKDWRIFHQDLPNQSEKRHRWLLRDGVILRDLLEEGEESIPRSQLPDEALIKIPLVAGAAAEVDASYEMYSYLDWNDTTKFSTYLESSLGTFGQSLSREVIDRYFRPESTPWQTFASLLSDVRTICPLYYAALERADPYVPLPVYFYVATQRKLTGMGYVAEAHADISAILGTYTIETREEEKFVKNMEKLFYEFVEKGQIPEAQDVTRSILKVGESIQKIFTYPNCDFWQEHQFYPNYSRVD